MRVLLLSHIASATVAFLIKACPQVRQSADSHPQLMRRIYHNIVQNVESLKRWTRTISFIIPTFDDILLLRYEAWFIATLCCWLLAGQIDPKTRALNLTVGSRMELCTMFTYPVQLSKHIMYLLSSLCHIPERTDQHQLGINNKKLQVTPWRQTWRLSLVAFLKAETQQEASYIVMRYKFALSSSCWSWITGATGISWDKHTTIGTFTGITSSQLRAWWAVN